MKESQTSETLKTGERITKRFNKDDIYISMEHLPDLDTYQYKVECHGCVNQCDFAFLYQKKLSFAFVGRLAGVFSSPCAKLAKAAAEKSRRAGLMLPGLDASNSHNYEV